MSSLTVSRPPAAQGLAWIRQGWVLFKPSALSWSGMTALVFLALLGIGVLPYLGGPLIHILSPFVVAGFMAASQSAQRGELVNFLYLGAGFQAGRDSLFIIGLLYMLGSLLVFRLVAVWSGGDMTVLMTQIENPQSLSRSELEAMLDGLLPALALGSLLMVPLLMATWFSPALAHFDGFRPIQAMWWSLWACAVNWRPLLLYSTVLALLGIAAMVIPFGLGLLVFIPLTLTSTYVAYRDIFVPIAPAAPA